MEIQPDRALELRAHRAGLAWSSPVVRYLVRLAPSSRASQLQALRVAAAAFGAELAAVDWLTVDNAQMDALRAWLGARYAPQTANRILCAVRGVLVACVRSGELGRDAYERAIDVPPVRGSRVPRGRSLSGDELGRLVAAARARGGAVGLRHAAVLALLWGGGLRRAEACALRVADFNAATGDVRIMGKGNKQRVIPLPARAADAVRAWLTARGRAEGFLFCPVLRGEPRPRRGLSAAAVYKELLRLARAAQVPHFSPHDLRRTYVGDLLDAGGDLATVQALVGHSDPATTARYDRRGERSRRAAVARLAEPF
jgi:integrase